MCLHGKYLSSGKHTNLHCSALLHCCRRMGPSGFTQKQFWVWFSGGPGQIARKRRRKRISLIMCAVSLQHSSVDGFAEPPAPPTKSASRHSLPRCRNSFTSTEEHPHIGNYRLLKTIGKGNFAKVKLARHVLTGREVRLCFINDLEDVAAEIFIIANPLSMLLMSPTVTCIRA